MSYRERISRFDCSKQIKNKAYNINSKNITLIGKGFEYYVH
jgi:hypothetical protein